MMAGMKSEITIEESFYLYKVCSELAALLSLNRRWSLAVGRWSLVVGKPWLLNG
jgi:hypothetical protein